MYDFNKITRVESCPRN